MTTSWQIGEHSNRDGEAPEQHEMDRLANAVEPLEADETDNAADGPDAAVPVPSGTGFKLSSLPRSVYIPPSSARDHLANERVFLGYIRTSSAFANFAVVILQLYRLNRSSAPADRLSDFDLGIPFATATLVIGTSVALIGAARFFICQNAMIRGRAIGSGLVVVIFIAATSLVSFKSPLLALVASLT